MRCHNYFFLSEDLAIIPHALFCDIFKVFSYVGNVDAHVGKTYTN